jgi:trimeric autotransporter adhesin
MTRHGSVHGGQQPVSGATIQLYAVGTTGDDSVATPLLSTTTTTDANGSFDITGKYTCPAGASLVYITATGGNPGLAPGTNNTALSMMSTLGRCDSLTASTFIFINEVTTVAAVSALSPFMTSPSAVGSATNDAAALANAFALASAFVNTSTGTSPGLNVPTGTVVPDAKINTLANVVTSCVNSAGGTANDGSVCGTLFTLATVQGQQPPTNIITALNNVASNPALNTAPLFNLAPSAAPYQPTLAAPPADFSIHLTSTGGTGPSGPVTLSPTTLNFYQTNVPQTITMTNSGLTPVIIQNINISSSNWSQTTDCGTILPAQSTCTINVQSTSSTLGTFTGSLTVVDDDTNDAQVVQLNTDNETLAGTINFGPSSIGTAVGPAPLGGVAVDNVLSGNLTGSNPDTFTVYDELAGQLKSPFNCIGLPGNSQNYCTLFILFTPSAVGTQSSLLVTSTGTYLLTGTGLPHGPHFFFPDTTFDFGSTSPGLPVLSGVHLSNNGDAQASILLPIISGPNASDFTVTGNFCSLISPMQPSGVGRTYSTSPYHLFFNFPTDCEFLVTFNPSATGPRTANLTLTDSSGRQQTELLTGISTSNSPLNPPPTVSMTSLSFGNVQVGATATIQSVSVLSPNLAAVTAQIVGSNNYTVQPGTCAQGVAVCTLFVKFLPTSVGSITGTLYVTSAGSSASTLVSLNGSGGESTVSLSSTSLNFGTNSIGTISPPQTITFTNNGPAVLNISNVAITAVTPGEFIATSGNCAASIVLTVGQSCTLSVSFAPQTTGTRTGIVQIFSNDPSSPDTIQLTGVAQ